MYLKDLSIINFKNYKSVELELSPTINCFTGNNGVGKTNILDAIHYLSLCKSYFNPIDSQNINHENDFFVIDGHYIISDKAEKIYCGLKRSQKKKFSRNKKDYTKLSDHIGMIPIVVVSPADIELITEGSEERRKFIDTVISQYDKDYLELIIRYNKALSQRNYLLKQFAEKKYFEESEIDVWNYQLIQCGQIIYEKRKLFTEQLSPVFREYYQLISEGKEEVTLQYISDIENSDLESLLKKNIDKDRILQYTTKGCHKDDLLMKMHDFPIKKTGSQGQQKTYLVSLKLAEYDYIREKTGKKPILLLDDIFDKFDNSRVEKIINLIGNDKFGQIFMTDTDPERLLTILSEQEHEHKIFHINENQEFNLI